MPLQLGSRAPDFTLFDTDIKQRSLNEFLGKKLVLAFFPGAFTGVCTNEMCTFRDTLAGLESQNVRLVAISTDSPFANNAFKDANNLKFPLLCDVTRQVSVNFCGLYDSFAHIPGYKASKRSIFVLDAGGTVKYVWITENPGVEPNYEEVRKVLDTF